MKEELGTKYRVLIERDEDGVYVAEVPSLPGCISQGQTRAEVLDHIKEAIAGYLESLKKVSKVELNLENLEKKPN